MRPRADEAPMRAKGWPFDEAALDLVADAELAEAVPVLEPLVVAVAELLDAAVDVETGTEVSVTPTA